MFIFVYLLCLAAFFQLGYMTKQERMNKQIESEVARQLRRRKQEGEWLNRWGSPNEGR